MNDRSRRDSLYATPRDEVEDFSFDRHVAQVFPDMIRRSVPGYATVVNMCGVLAAAHAQTDSHLYDLGCSLGATTLALHRGVQVSGCRIFGIDNSAEMLDQAQARIDQVPGRSSIELVEADVRSHPIENASMVTLNFTLQFIPPEERLDLLKRIHQGMRRGGILVLSEKIAFVDPQAEALQVEMHHAFKRANGYNDLEISQKRSALERVMIPESLETHQQRLHQAGFSRSDLWFQCFNFASLVARR